MIIVVWHSGLFRSGNQKRGADRLKLLSRLPLLLDRVISNGEQADKVAQLWEVHK